MTSGAEHIDNLFVHFYFDRLPYTFTDCTIAPVNNDRGFDDMELEALRDDQLIGVYRKLRERRDEAKKAFVEVQKPGLELMNRIEGELQKRMQVNGQSSIACKGVGTACVVRDSTVKVENWSAFFEWVQDTKSFDMLERRAAKQAVMDFAEKEQQLPPGLSMKVEESIQIRAPRGG